MPNKRADNKVRVTVPMEDELLKRIELYAKKMGVNRVEAMKEMCKVYLQQKKENK